MVDSKREFFLGKVYSFTTEAAPAPEIAAEYLRSTYVWRCWVSLTEEEIYKR
jgi:hypothetical protein